MTRNLNLVIWIYVLALAYQIKSNQFIYNQFSYANYYYYYYYKPSVKKYPKVG